jgi:hypothetical protein
MRPQVLSLSLHAHGPNAVLIAAITMGNLPEAMSACGMLDADPPCGHLFNDD